MADTASSTTASSTSITEKPAVVGHSFGGLLAQILTGRGLSAASVAIDPAPFRGCCRCRCRH
jgi:pimeloyl-ACP methyl ester carboxylesterase